MSFSGKESMTQGSSIEDTVNLLFKEADKMKDGIDYDFLRQTLTGCKGTEGIRETEQPEESLLVHCDSGATTSVDVPIHDRNVEEKKSRDLPANYRVQSDKIMADPICLIENRVEKGKLRLIPNREAINILSKIQQPVVVVAVVGLYRTGKSYLMNKLAGAMKGFRLGSTVQSQTKGIWMWCVPHPTINDHTLVLLDTEGLGDVEKGDDKNDAWLFSLAVLLSSVLVYNSKGTIDQDALDKLKFVMEISEMIKLKSNNDEDEEDEFSKYFPSFVWTVRDFTLQLIADGKNISEDEYMELAFKLKQGGKLSRKEKEFNELRMSIRKFFGKRKCFAFDMPTADKSLLQHLTDVPDSELSDSFVAQTQNFCDYIFKNAEVKRMDMTVPVNGHRFGELVEIYAKAVNSSKVVCMEEAMVTLAEKENTAAVHEAIQHYEDNMKKAKLPTETLNDLMTLSTQYENEARQMFLKRSFKDDDKRFIQSFMENIKKKRTEFISMNEKESWEICDTLIKKLFKQFEQFLAEGAYNVPGGHGLYKKDINDIEEKYKMEGGKGVKAVEALIQYIESKLSAQINIIQQDNALNLKEKEAAEENNRRKIHEMEQDFRRQLVEQSNQMEADNKAVLEQTISKMTRQMEKERKVMNENMERTIREKAKEQELYLKQGLQEQANKFQAQMETLQRERLEAEKLHHERYEQLLKVKDNQIETFQELTKDFGDKLVVLSNRPSCTIS